MPKPKPTRKTLADQIRERIAEGDYTAAAVGEAAGVSAPVVSRFLAGERDIRLETADMIAGALGLALAPVRKPTVKARIRSARTTGGPPAEANRVGSKTPAIRGGLMP